MVNVSRVEKSGVHSRFAKIWNKYEIWSSSWYGRGKNYPSVQLYIEMHDFIRKYIAVMVNHTKKKNRNF